MTDIITGPPITCRHVSGRVRQAHDKQTALGQAICLRRQRGVSQSVQRLFRHVTFPPSPPSLPLSVSLTLLLSFPVAQFQSLSHPDYNVVISLKRPSMQERAS